MNFRTLMVSMSFTMVFGQTLMGEANAQLDVSQCDSVLIVANVRNDSRVRTDYRLAGFVSEEAYRRASTADGLDATIFGIPVGANWNEYRQAAARSTRRLEQSLTIDEARSYMWMGLDEDSAAEYASCITALSDRPGLVVTGQSASESAAVIAVRWHRGSALDAPETVSLRWQSAELTALGHMPTSASIAAPSLISILRPEKGSVTIVVEGRDDKGRVVGSGRVVVTAYSPPPLPPAALERVRLISKTVRGVDACGEAHARLSAEPECKAIAKADAEPYGGLFADLWVSFAPPGSLSTDSGKNGNRRWCHTYYTAQCTYSIHPTCGAGTICPPTK